jgi:hypothetical protein
MSAAKKKPAKGGANPAANPPGPAAGGSTSPAFVMNEVTMLVGDITSPETGVTFNPPARNTPSSIQNTIAPPQPTWIWKDQPTRDSWPVTALDIGKYGLETDVNILFRLSSVSPATTWEAVTDFSNATWTWINAVARTAQPVTPLDVGKVGFQSDINTYYQLTAVAPAVWKAVPNPANSSPSLELATGAADADSYHDFYRLTIAFEDVWAELLDTDISQVAQQLYAAWDALMDTSTDPTNPAYDDSGAADRAKRFAPAPPPDVPGGPNPADISGADELVNFLNNLGIILGVTSGAASTSSVPADVMLLKNAVTQTLAGCNMLLTELNRDGSRGQPAAGSTWDHNNWLNATPGNNDNTADPDDLASFPPGTRRADVFTNIANSLTSLSSATNPADPTVSFPDITKLLTQLDGMLKERYRFDVFAPASINYGLLVNYRQHWQPQSYQVGNLVSTIPLAPQETRRYTTKTVIKKTRSTKELEDSLRSSKDESSNTSRVDAEIVNKAKNQTNFQTNAKGSYGNDALFKVEAGMQTQTDQAVESAQTTKEFHEAVLKTAQEYRNEHRMEVTTEESREDESTSFREIKNPNDELTVTYLFYELQRRYLVDESLFRITPVVLVANDVPAPHEVDQGWILRHDWIIKRAILDDSFLPALEYVATSYTGAEVTLQTLELAVEHQKAVVDRITQQVLLANQSLSAATVGLQDAQNQDINSLKAQETLGFIKSIFDPLGIGQAGKTDGNTDRAQLDFAKDALNRAQTKVDQLTSLMRTESTALQVAIDKYTAAATKHYEMLADIDRLRIHVKDNILHYMQAIWTYEPTDQRYFRLYNLDAPTFVPPAAPTLATVAPNAGFAKFDTARQAYSIQFSPPVLGPPMKLHQIADLDTFLGFKGNYMIFPMVNFDNYMAWYLVQNYIHFDDAGGLVAADPDPNAGMSLGQLQTAMAAILAQDPASFAANEAEFAEIMLRLLSDQTPEMVIVPSNSLYIEALPGTHPLLEDFKLIHRAIDIKRAQADARKAELENLRIAARLANGELGDPHVDKVVVVGSGQNVTVDAGQ